jgi:hypothetical protein
MNRSTDAAIRAGCKATRFHCSDALLILHKLAGKRLDPKAVEAFTAVFERGEVRVPRKVAAQPVAVIPEPEPRDIAAALETTRI